MGSTPAKTFPRPTAYGQSPDMGVVQQAQAPPLAPPQNFLPLNPPDQSAQQQPQQQGQQPAGLANGLFGGGGAQSDLASIYNRNPNRAFFNQGMLNV